MIQESGKSLLRGRLAEQQESCLSLFEHLMSTDYRPELRLKIDCYYIRMDDMGRFRDRELAKYLGEMLTQYVHTLTDIVASSISPRSFQKLSLDAARLIRQKRESGDLGEIVLWMLIEGVLGIPKVLSKHPHKTNIRLPNFGTDAVHAQWNPLDSCLELYVGESKLRTSLDSSIGSVIESFETYITGHNGNVPLDQDVYLVDKYAVEDADLTFLTTLKDFCQPGSSTRGSARFVFCVFTGYDSQLLAELGKLSFEETEKFLRDRYKIEMINASEKIERRVDRSDLIRMLRIVWFVLPFQSVRQFEDEVIHVISGNQKP